MLKSTTRHAKNVPVLLHQGARIGLSLAASVLVCSPCYASLAGGDSNSLGPNGSLYIGNGELFLSVFDNSAKISYTLDLGLDLNSFFISGQQDTGGQLFFPVIDAQWADFISRSTVNAANLRWSVLGLDQTGGLTPGGVRLFQTIQQGDEAKVATMLNSNFTIGTGATQVGGFFSGVNKTGTHGTASVTDYTVNGSSVNAAADNPKAYYGASGAGISTTLTGSAPYDMSNAVDKSSWFYYVSRSSTSQTGKVTVDEFDNLGHDGYWGFTKVGDNVDSPFKGQYLLSYTLESSLPTAKTVAGQARVNFLDYAAGLQSRSVDAPLGEFAGYQVSSLIVPSPVPEPATWGLFGLGLLGLALRKARQRRA